MPYGDQALFMPKAIFEKIGGFPSTPIAEDLYLVRRLGRLGRIALAPGAAVTSGRRWRNIGIWRTTLVNYMIAIGCIAGINPKKTGAAIPIMGAPTTIRIIENNPITK
jgi:hypothetical protein